VRVIPVLDLRAGRAVQARGGLRAAYSPAPSALAPGRPAGDAVALAQAYRRLGCDECYVADLDAIAGAPPQRALIRSLGGAGLRLLLDNGAADPARAGEAVADGVGPLRGRSARRAEAALARLPRAPEPLDVAEAVARFEAAFDGRFAA